MSTPSERPTLELSFYFHHLTDKSAFSRLVSAARRLGADVAGQGLVQCGPGLRDQPFGSVTDPPPREVEITSPEAFERLLTGDPDQRLVEVRLSGAVGPLTAGSEPFGYLPIAAAVQHVDRHPLAISTDGEPVSWPARGRAGERAVELGQRVYRRFVDLVLATSPSYAAITSKWKLESPSELWLDPRSDSFRDFYVAKEWVDDEGLARIRALCEGAYFEELPGGLYVSCWRFFNPEHRDVKGGWLFCDDRAAGLGAIMGRRPQGLGIDA